MNDSNQVRQGELSSPPERSSPTGEHQPIEADALALSAQGEESNAAREPDLAAGKQAKVRVEYKHSLATRWMHWINFPLLFLMIYSGILIYWADSQHEGLNAHHVYRVGIGDWTLFCAAPQQRTRSRCLSAGGSLSVRTQCSWEIQNGQTLFDPQSLNAYSYSEGAR